MNDYVSTCTRRILHGIAFALLLLTALGGKTASAVQAASPNQKDISSTQPAATDSESVVEVGGWHQGPAQVIAFDAAHSLVYLGAGKTILILDVSGGGDAQQIGVIETASEARDLDVADGFLYVVSNGTGLNIFDVSTPTSPQSMGSLPYEEAHQVEAGSGYVYIAAGYQGLRIVDVTNPLTPQEVGSVTGVDLRATHVALAGQWVYFVFAMYNEISGAEDGYMYAVDVSNPATPVPAGHFFKAGRLLSQLVVSGDYVYLLDWPTESPGGLNILDVSDPSNIEPVTFYDLSPYIPTELAVKQNLVLLGGAGGQDSFSILDATNITAPVQTDGILLQLHGFAIGAAGIAAGEDQAYLATGSGGLRIVSIADPSHLVEVGSSSPTPWLTSLAAYGPYLYASTADQTYIFSVTDPSQPVKIKGFGPYSTDHVAISGNLAIVTNVYGLRVFSLTDPLNPVEIGDYEAPNFTPLSVMIDGDIAYVRADPYAEPSPDLVVFDISDPTEPTVITTWEGSTPLGIRRTVLHNKHLYVVDPLAGLTIIDVSTPTAPTLAGTYAAECYMQGIAFSGDYAFVRDSDCDPIDGYPKLVVLDISTPSAPGKVTELAFDGLIPPGGQLAIKDERLFITGSRLDIIDISNPLAPQNLGTVTDIAAGGELTISANCLYLRNVGFTTLQYGDRTCMPAPMLLNPENHVQITGAFPLFDWDGIGSADHYEFQLDSEPLFLSPRALESSPSDSEFQPVLPIAPNQRYYWRVRAVDADGYASEWSVIRSVVSYSSVLITKPPALQSPAANALVNDYTPTLRWSTVSVPAGAVFGHYQIQLGEENTFSSPLVDWSIYNVDTTSYTAPTELTPNRTYYWRVRAFNDLNQAGSWSAIRAFRTQITAPELLSPAYAEHLLSSCYAFDWTDVEGASSYRIQMAQNPGTFSPLRVNVTSTASGLSSCSLPRGVVLYWRVQANGLNGPSPWSTFIGFYTANPPGVPALASPADNALVTNYSPLLKWNQVQLPTGTSFGRYRVQIATDAAFTKNLREYTTGEGMITDCALSPVPALDANARYYWRVRAENDANQYSAWTVVRSFRSAIQPPVLDSPENADSLNNLSPTLEWEAVDGATGYTLVISKSASLSAPIKSVKTADSSYSMPTNLPAATKLYWRVQATGPNGPSLWSLTWSFTTGSPPSVPVLVSPAKNALLKNYAPTLNWNNSKLPASTAFRFYEIQVDDNANFSSPVIDETTALGDLADSDFTPLTDLDAGTRYYWRVRAVNDVAGTDHFSAWSATWYFRTVADT